MEKKFRPYSKMCGSNASSQQCEIAPSILAAFSLKVTSKYSAIHLCCLFSKYFLFFMGSAVSNGPALVWDSKESIYTCCKWRVVHVNWQQHGETQMLSCAHTLTHTQTHKHKHTDTRFVWKQKRDQNTLTSHSRTVFTLHKSSMSGTLESFINI